MLIQTTNTCWFFKKQQLDSDLVRKFSTKLFCWKFQTSLRMWKMTETLSFRHFETGLSTKIVKWVKSLFHRVSDIYFWQRRVWSWLRTNAGGVPHTCKSNEKLSSESGKWRTGEYNIGNLPLGGGQQRETSANTPYERSWNAILESSGA